MLIGKRLGSDMHIIVNEAHLVQRSWCFGHSESIVYAPLLRFGKGGRLIGYRHANESSWAILDDRVALLDEAGLPSTIFDRSSIGLDGRLRLEGRHRDSAVIHFLREVDLGAGPAPYSPSVKLIQRQPIGRRRNLVVLRANEQSLHTSWLRDIQDRDRSWDLCISYYGKIENFPPEDFSEFACLQNKQRKFTALKSLIHEGSILWAYDYIMFPDDDLQMKWSDLKPEFLLRFVTMVELMAPIFSNGALRSCIHTFDLNQSGYGIDYAWTKLVDGPLTKIAVIDRVAVRHTRPTGNSYDLKAAIDEGYETSDKFGFLDQYSMRELGGILAHKVVDPDKVEPDESLTLQKFAQST
jgi:hypothetical protein